MINKQVEQIGITIEKLNYLYKGIQKRKGKSKKIEVKLLKQYAAELYDAALALEINALDVVQTPTLEEDIPVVSVPSSSSSKIDIVPADVVDLEEETKEAAQSAEEIVNKVADETLNLEADETETAAEVAQEALTDSVEAVEDGFDNVAEKLERKAEDLLTEDVPEVSPIKEKIAANLPEMPSIKGKIKGMVEEGKTGMETVVKKVKGLVNVPEEVAETVKNKVVGTPKDEVIEATKDKVEAAKNAVVDAAKDKVDAVKNDVVETAKNKVEDVELPKNEVVEPPKRVKGTVRKTSTKVFDINHESGEVNVVTDPKKMTLPPDPKPKVEQDETVRLELNDILAKDKSKVSIADKLKEPNKSGGSFDITFNDRFAYINELFRGDSDAFNKAIDEIASSGGYIEALTYINLNVKHKYNWKSDSATAKRFMNLVKNKFLG